MSGKKSKRRGMSANQRGHDSENRVNNALYTLKVRNIIVGYERAKTNDALDSAGIDFIVYFCPDGVNIRSLYLQVKSSFAGLRSGKYHHAKRHTAQVKFVVGGDNHDLLCKYLKTLVETASHTAWQAPQ